MNSKEMEEKYLEVKDNKMFDAPTIDMKKLVSHQSEVEKLYLEKVSIRSKLTNVKLVNDYISKHGKLPKALVNSGFLYIKNHGVSKTLIEKVWKISHDFYHCTHEQRKELEDFKGKLIHDGSAFSLPVFDGS